MTTPRVIRRVGAAARAVATRAHREQRAATIFMFVFFVMTTIAVGAVALDYGSLVVERRDQQKSVDSIVLAGVQELPDDTILSDQYAREWGLRNGVADTEIVNLTLDNTCWNDHPDDDPDQIDSITADISRPGQLFLLGELGFSLDVGAHAKACVGSLREAEGLRPWSISILESPCFDYNGVVGDPIEEADVTNYVPQYGQECVIRLESPSSQVGSIRLGDDPGDPCDETGGGAAKYVENIEEGSDAVCEIGGDVDTEPGLQVGPTLTALENLLAGEGACDAAHGEYPLGSPEDPYDELLESFNSPGGPPGPDTIFVPLTCPGSPIFDGDPGTPDTVRFVTLVLIDAFDSPTGFDTEEIVAFAGFFIDRCEVTDGAGVVTASYKGCEVPPGDQSNVQIVGTFIQYMQLGGAGGPLNPFGVRIFALVE